MTNDELLSRITVHPNIRHGKPCIRGLRYTVEYILEQLSNGSTVRELLARHPELKADDIRAAFAYGVRSNRVKPVTLPGKIFHPPMTKPASRGSLTA